MGCYNKAMPAPTNEKPECPLCTRQADLTFHHYIPRKVHRRAHFKKRYSKSELQTGIDICILCHRGIHKYYDEMELAKHLNNLVCLQADQALSNHFNWVAKQRISS